MSYATLSTRSAACSRFVAGPRSRAGGLAGMTLYWLLLPPAFAGTSHLRRRLAGDGLELGTARSY